MWNRRPTESSALHAAISEIIAPYRGDAPAHSSGAWREAFAGRELTERRFEFIKSYSVIAMGGLAPRLTNRRQVQMTDAEARKIGYEARYRGKILRTSQLQSISGMG